MSVTTDGFITDIDNLEAKLVKEEEEKFKIISFFKELRFELSGDSQALELKSNGVGIISWTTRGQLGLESKIKATTGFQTRGYTQEELIVTLTKTLQSENKELEYVQNSLRSAYDIYKDGGHVTMVYSDKIFRLLYDNKRIIVDNSSDFGYLNLISNNILSKDEPTSDSATQELIDSKDSATQELIESKEATLDITSTLLDSRPARDITRCKNQRFLSKIGKLKIYNRETSLSNVQSRGKYKSKIELAIRNFVKGILSNPTMFNLGVNPFKNYAEILEYLNSYPNKGNLKMTKDSLSKLRNRKLIFKIVPKTKDTLLFVDFVKIKFPSFDEESFFTRF